MNEENLKEIEEKLSEYKTLTNKLTRYWRKLAKEALKEAKRKGLEIVITDSEIIPFADIILKRTSYEVDVTKLIKLVKERYPSLHRRYHNGLIKHKQLESELNTIYENLSGDRDSMLI